jgi:hypothetical protein
MNEIAIILGIVACSFLSLYFIKVIGEIENTLNKNSQNKPKNLLWIKLISISFFLVFMMIIPSFLIGNQETCNILVNETTTINNVTAYDYDQVCFPQNISQSNTIFKIVILFFRLIILAFTLYFVWFMLKDNLLNSKELRRNFKNGKR